MTTGSTLTTQPPSPITQLLAVSRPLLMVLLPEKVPSHKGGGRGCLNADRVVDTHRG